MAVSLLIQYCSKSFIEDCGGSLVDRGAGIKIEVFTSLTLLSPFAHARYKYQCSNQDLPAKGYLMTMPLIFTIHSPDILSSSSLSAC